jgi:CRISPR-associated protein Cas2
MNEEQTEWRMARKGRGFMYFPPHPVRVSKNGAAWIMLMLITYDVATTTPEGRRRLRKVAQACKNYGQRAQKSVFECVVEPEHWVVLRNSLLEIINPDEDSLRFYPLDENVRRRIEHIGVKEPIDFEGPLIF